MLNVKYNKGIKISYADLEDDHEKTIEKYNNVFGCELFEYVKNTYKKLSGFENREYILKTHYTILNDGDYVVELELDLPVNSKVNPFRCIDGKTLEMRFL